MIRINLLGQARPRAAKKAVPLEATVQVVFALVALLVAAAILGITYYQQRSELERTNAKIASLRAEKASLQQIKQEVDRFESQKGVLQQRIDVIEALQRNRSGGQELLQMVADTVVRADSVWLTAFDRTGNSLNMEGEAASIDAVANFITQLKRSGYFDNVEIKQAIENDILPSVETYAFSMTASVSQAAHGAQPKAQPTAGPQVSLPPAKGRS
ncbi:MAG TPA: PilN domain-containing protein [Verrucomicrobiae bacterium]|jgi:Tfp pilus assembly protein PilN|nr:PilN domain-containing protein [Verrucomicrobiae bacterium]